MSDDPNTEPNTKSEPQQDQTTETPGEMTAEDLEKVSGGVTAQDFTVTKKVDKSSPSL